MHYKYTFFSHYDIELYLIHVSTLCLRNFARDPTVDRTTIDRMAPNRTTLDRNDT